MKVSRRLQSAVLAALVSISLPACGPSDGPGGAAPDPKGAVKVVDTYLAAVKDGDADKACAVMTNEYRASVSGHSAPLSIPSDCKGFVAWMNGLWSSFGDSAAVGLAVLVSASGRTAYVRLSNDGADEPPIIVKHSVGKWMMTGLGYPKGHKAKTPLEAAKTVKVGNFGEAAGIRVRVDAMAKGGDSLGPWLTTDARIETKTATTVPEFAIFCGKETEAGGYQADSTVSFGDDLPASIGVTLNLLRPDDARTGEAVPECKTPAWIVVGIAGNPDSVKVRVPDDVVAELNGATAQQAPASPAQAVPRPQKPATEDESDDSDNSDDSEDHSDVMSKAECEAKGWTWDDEMRLPCERPDPNDPTGTRGITNEYPPDDEDDD